MQHEKDGSKSRPPDGSVRRCDASKTKQMPPDAPVRTVYCKTPIQVEVQNALCGRFVVQHETGTKGRIRDNSGRYFEGLSKVGRMVFIIFCYICRILVLKNLTLCRGAIFC